MPTCTLQALSATLRGKCPNALSERTLGHFRPRAPLALLEMSGRIFMCVSFNSNRQETHIRQRVACYSVLKKLKHIRLPFQQRRFSGDFSIFWFWSPSLQTCNEFGGAILVFDVYISACLLAFECAISCPVSLWGLKPACLGISRGAVAMLQGPLRRGRK